MREIDYFFRILKHKHPNHFNKINISVNTTAYPNSGQYLNRDCTEYYYYCNSYEQNIIITFPNIDTLYYDICSFIRFVWGVNNVIAEFDTDGTHYFNFKV